MNRVSLPIVAALAAIASPAAAATITPVAVLASNTFSFFGEYRAANLIDGSGLNAAGLHDNQYFNMWQTDLGVNQATLTFDLGGVYALSGVDLWQYNFGNPSEFQSTILRGVKDFRILTSLDGTAFNQIFAGRMSLGSGQALPAQVFGLVGNARYVTIDILNNYGQGTYAEASWNSGLSEVRFEGVAAIPEPATWGMLIAGFGMAGATLRRRTVRFAAA